jgi:CRISPR/Cas system CSM-associated protein Csm3 (group 7 of RAMP superfamily)
MSTSQRYIHIELLSYWHAGSGVGQGSLYDATVIKDPNGLPYLPGRTLKGLLRDALHTCENAEQVPNGITETLFGRQSCKGTSDPSSTTQGIIYVSNATLPKEVEQKLIADIADTTKPALRDALFDRFVSTSLDENGIATDKTLRSVELCVPLELYAMVSMDTEDPAHWEALGKACSLIRALGSHRQRGLGRCKLSLKSTSQS